MTEAIQLFDGAAEAARDGDALLEAARAVVASGRYILGAEVDAFEQELSAHLSANGAIQSPRIVSCASGTDALWLALRALSIGPGDEVVVPAFTFFATASAVLATGATPVVCDIEPHTFGLDPDALDALLECRDTGRTRAVIVVHLFGQPASARLIDVARKHGLLVVEDAAQSYGALCGAQPVGTIGDVGCFSFFPTKNLGGFGDGGAVLTSDDAIAAKLRRLRAHGTSRRYVHDEAGTNSRLDALQAAMLRVRLRTIDARLHDRVALADRYDTVLDGVGVVRPVRAPDRTHSFNLYVVRVPEERDALASALAEASIPTAVHYPGPVHLQGALAPLGYRPGDMPVAEAACDEVLTLPFYPSMPHEHADVVASEIARFTASRSPSSAGRSTSD